MDIKYSKYYIYTTDMFSFYTFHKLTVGLDKKWAANVHTFLYVKPEKIVQTSVIIIMQNRGTKLLGKVLTRMQI